MSSSAHSILELDRVTMRFKVGGNLWNSQSVTAVDNVTLAVPKGVTVGIVGESGSGKSTLARIALGLVQPTAGEVRVDGRTLRSRSARELRTMRRQIQAVFQDPSSSLNPRQTVNGLVAAPFLVHRNLAPRDPTSAVVQTLQRVGLGREHLGRFPHQLSGGQRQRVAIARALILGPELIIADEPTSALDVSIQAQIVSLLRGIQADTGCGLLFISHNLGIVRHLADWVAVMYLGRIVELGPSRAVFSQASHPYTQMLIDAVPIPDPGRRRSLPDLQTSALPWSVGRQGCRFADRCPKRFDRCLVEDPEDIYVEEDHFGACHLNEGKAVPATGSAQPAGADAGMPVGRWVQPAAGKRWRKKEMR